MIINTNISDTVFIHDPIAFAPIEKQVLGFFSTYFTVIYEITGSGLVFIMDDYKCSVKITKKGVSISLSPPDNGICFGEGPYPSINLPYNRDVTQKVKKFCDMIHEIQKLEEKAKALSKVDRRKIEAFLEKELGTDHVTVRFWVDNLFNGIEITFYIHPIGTAPADGIVVCLEKDTNKINPFWNRSTTRRSQYYSDAQQIEHAVGNAYGSDVASMKKKITAIEQVKSKIDNFDPSKSPEFLQLLEVKKQADDLVREFNALTKGTK